MKLHYSDSEDIFQLTQMGDVYGLSFNVFDKIPFISDVFSTRLGGVSTDEFTSMNLSFARGDDHLAVHENFRRMMEVIGASPEDVVFCKQTHTNKVVRVNGNHKGKLHDFYKECAYEEKIKKDHSVENVSKVYAFEEVDGMVTNTPGVCLFTSYADCVPLYFVDPVQKAIGLSHSGWRGTVGKIGAVTVETMVREFGSNPADIIAGIGPCICQDCYEVSEDVVEEFLQAGIENALEYQLISRCKMSDYESDNPTDWSNNRVNSFVTPTGNGKYRLDLRKANELILVEAGILKENIVTTNVCTACNHEVLFSHRASQGKRGNLGAFLMIKK